MAEDAELFAAWREGDDRAGNQLFERHFEPIFRFFRNKVTDGAEDLVQQTFLACVRNADAYRKDASFRTYLFTIARSKLLDHLRVKRRKRDPIDFLETSLADLGTSPSGLIAKRQEERLLHVALHRLPLELQMAIELFYFENLPAREVAQVLEIPEGTVRSRVRRAVTRLREEIPKLGEDARLTDSTLSHFRLLTARRESELGPAED